METQNCSTYKKNQSNAKKNRFSFSNLYTKKPIFRRKLIEKYSTTRYNFNTKLIYNVLLNYKKKKFNYQKHQIKQLPKKTNCSYGFNSKIECQKNDDFKNSNDSSIIVNKSNARYNFKTLYNSPNGLEKYNYNESDTNKDIVQEIYIPHNKEKIHEPPTNISCENSDKFSSNLIKDSNKCFFSPIKNDKTNETNNLLFQNKINKVSESTEENKDVSHLSNNHQILRNNINIYKKMTTNKNDFILEDIKNKKPISSPILTRKKLKLVSNNIYTYLAEFHEKNILTTKINKVKRTKRNCSVRKMKKLNSYAHSFNRSHYNEILNNYSNNSETSKCSNDENLIMTMYLGVNRPLFPLIYKNLLTSYKEDDVEITDSWANFSLSTLITQISDNNVKKYLVPVKDSQLLTTISKFNDKFGTCNEEVEITKYEFNISNKYMNNSILSTHLESKKEELFTDNTTSDIIEKYNLKSSPKINETDTDLLNKYNYGQCCVKIPRLNVSLNDTVFLIAKENGHNEIYKLNSSELKTNNEKSYHEPNVEKESCIQYPNNQSLSLEGYYFGTNRCTRTCSIMIDYALRNRSLVYLYKIKRILNFQKKNNIYFKSCCYICIGNEISDEIENSIDVTSSIYNENHNTNVEVGKKDFSTTHTTENNNNKLINSNIEIIDVSKSSICKFTEKCDYIEFNSDDENVDFGMTKNVVDESLSTCNTIFSYNPDDIFKASKILELKELYTNNKNLFHTVDEMHFKSAKNVRWCMLTLNKSLVHISYAKKHVTFNILFELVFRAELSKKVVHYNINCKSKNSINDGLKFGVYAFPGICNDVFFGPYTLQETHELSGAIKSLDNEVIEVSVKTNFDFSLNEIHTDNIIYVSWWFPILTSNYMSDINSLYLNSFFTWNEANQNYLKSDNIQIAEILKMHESGHFLEYKFQNTESNFVLFHSSTINDHKNQNELIENNSTLKHKTSSIKKTRCSLKGFKGGKVSTKFWKEICIQKKNLCSLVLPQEKHVSCISLRALINEAIARIQFLKMESESQEIETYKLNLINKMLLIKLRKRTSCNFNKQKNESRSRFPSQSKLIDDNNIGAEDVSSSSETNDEGLNELLDDHIIHEPCSSSQNPNTFQNHTNQNSLLTTHSSRKRKRKNLKDSNEKFIKENLQIQNSLIINNIVPEVVLNEKQNSETQDNYSYKKESPLNQNLNVVKRCINKNLLLHKSVSKKIEDVAAIFNEKLCNTIKNKVEVFTNTVNYKNNFVSTYCLRNVSVRKENDPESPKSINEKMDFVLNTWLQKRISYRKQQSFTTEHDVSHCNSLLKNDLASIQFQGNILNEKESFPVNNIETFTARPITPYSENLINLPVEGNKIPDSDHLEFNELSNKRIGDTLPSNEKPDFVFVNCSQEIIPANNSQSIAIASFNPLFEDNINIQDSTDNLRYFQNNSHISSNSENERDSKYLNTNLNEINVPVLSSESNIGSNSVTEYSSEQRVPSLLSDLCTVGLNDSLIGLNNTQTSSSSGQTFSLPRTNSEISLNRPISSNKAYKIKCLIQKIINRLNVIPCNTPEKIVKKRILCQRMALLYLNLRQETNANTTDTMNEVIEISDEEDNDGANNSQNISNETIVENDSTSDNTFAENILDVDEIEINRSINNEGRMSNSNIIGPNIVNCEDNGENDSIDDCCIIENVPVSHTEIISEAETSNVNYTSSLSNNIDTNFGSSSYKTNPRVKTNSFANVQVTKRKLNKYVPNIYKSSRVKYRPIPARTKPIGIVKPNNIFVPVQNNIVKNPASSLLKKMLEFTVSCDENLPIDLSQSLDLQKNINSVNLPMDLSQSSDLLKNINLENQSSCTGISIKSFASVDTFYESCESNMNNLLNTV